MNAEDLHKLLLDKVGVRKVKQNSQGWVNATCPFESRHGGGIDEFPSFGIKVASDRSSKYNCKSGSCGMHGDNLLGLVFALEANKVKTLVPYDVLFQWVLERDNTLKEAVARKDPEERRAKKVTSSVYNWQSSVEHRSISSTTAGVVPSLIVGELPIPKILPETDLDAIRKLSDEAIAYLEGPKRQLTRETIAAWELGSRYGRVAIPVRDYQQRLVGISGRSVPSETKPPKGPKYLHSLGFKKDHFLFGESKKTSGRRAIAVEGQFDVIWLWQVGYQNALAIMGSDPSQQQIEKLVRWFDEVVVLGDGDPAGHKMARDTHEALKARMPARIAKPIEGKDPNEHTEEELSERLGPPDRLSDNLDRF